MRTEQLDAIKAQHPHGEQHECPRCREYACDGPYCDTASLVAEVERLRAAAEASVWVQPCSRTELHADHADCMATWPNDEPTAVWCAQCRLRAALHPEEHTP